MCGFRFYKLLTGLKKSYLCIVKNLSLNNIKNLQILKEFDFNLGLGKKRKLE